MVALGEESAAEVFKHLSEDEIEALSLEMAKAPKVPVGGLPRRADRGRRDRAGRGLPRRGRRRLRARGAGALARRRRREEIIGRLAATIERRPFEFLRRTPPEQIHVFLRNESPQTIALVSPTCTPRSPRRCSRCSARGAGRRRHAHRAHGRDAARGRRAGRGGDEAEALERHRAGVLARRRRQVARRHPQPRRPLDRAQRARPARADQRRAGRGGPLLLFVFEDVVKLDDRSIQLVLKEVDQKDLALALRGVAEDVAPRIFANMSERGAELLKEEMEFQPPQRRRVVEEAQGRIVGVVRRLEEAGALVISRGAGGGDDELM